MSSIRTLQQPLCLTSQQLSTNHHCSGAFEAQVACVTIAPAFCTASIYLILKHMVIAFGEQPSRLPAKWYTYIFIPCDILSLALQGAGGGIAAGSNDSLSQANLGNRVMLAGLIFQVFTLAIFGILSIDYAVRLRKHYREAAADGIPTEKVELNPATTSLRASPKFKHFLWALVAAYFLILVRCIYRIVELGGGWNNPILDTEWPFIVFDEYLIMSAVVLLNIWHPGRCFLAAR